MAMTAAATGLIALLDKPSSGLAGDLLGGSADGPLADPAALPDQGAPAQPTQPPVVSSTAPVIVVNGGSDDGGAGQTPVAVTPTQPPATTVPAATTIPAASGACEGKTVDGPSVNTRWGPVQVEAVISSSGQICDVTAIRSPNSHGRSVRINQQALPILHKQVMKAQSANISGVSGATVTSEGYVRSLQSILDGSSG